MVRIPVEVATKYVQFGTFLLDDRNGSRVKIMVHEHLNNAEQVNIAILQEWLIGRGKKPVSWTTLVKAYMTLNCSASLVILTLSNVQQDHSQKTQVSQLLCSLALAISILT